MSKELSLEKMLKQMSKAKESFKLLDESLILKEKKRAIEYTKKLADMSKETYKRVLVYRNEMEIKYLEEQLIRLMIFNSEGMEKRRGKMFGIDAEMIQEHARSLFDCVDKIDDLIEDYLKTNNLREIKDLEVIRGNVLIAAFYFKSSAYVLEAIAELYH